MSTMMKLRTTLFLLAFPSLLLAQLPFSLDSATTYLRTLSVEIGPRPMGSPNERRALQFAVGKFREFGLNEAYIMPMRDVPGQLSGGRINTESGIAVGVLEGSSERIIVLGAHIDSEGPEVAGANDDASGCAVLLELARVLAHQQLQSTLVFALFGGEEQGLLGSRYFVERFPEIERVVLMLQVDMANGTEWLVPTLDAGKESVPAWLVRAAYEELARLGHSGLYFPTHFFTLMNTLPGGGIGSDHQPFLERGIPAIDFTSDFRDPIHTPQDTFENFKTEGLKRSGDLVAALVKRFDAGVPPEKTEQYYLLQIGSLLFFLPLWLLTSFIVLSLSVAAYALMSTRHRRVVYAENQRPSVPGLKLFLLLLLIQTSVWLSENVVGWLKGDRFPWYASLDGYFLLAASAGAIGIWIGLNLSRRMHLRKDPYGYFLRAVLVLLPLLLAFAFLSVKLAIYPASALFLLSLAMLVHHPMLKLLFWLASPHFMYRLIFNEGFEFLARVVRGSPEIGMVGGVILHIIYVLFFSLWSFPFLLGFAAIWFDTKRDLFWLRRFRRPAGLVIALIAFFATAMYLSTKPSYSNEWKQKILIEQIVDQESGKVDMTVKSAEYLHGLRLRFLDRDTLIHDKILSASFTDLPYHIKPMVHATREVESVKMDTLQRVHLRLTMQMSDRPYTLNVSFFFPKGTLLNAFSPYAITFGERAVSVRWYSFPDNVLHVPLTFVFREGEMIEEDIQAVFTQLPLPVSAEKEMSNVLQRGRWESRHRIQLQVSQKGHLE
jgi:hypothetical protein